jgi:septal ring factor EnvC (AmiA/AmiB activator)
MSTSLERCLVSLLISLCFVSPSISADQQQQYKKSMQELAVEIKQISGNLNANRGRLKTEKDKLSSLEQGIISLDRKITLQSKKIHLQTKANDNLNAQILALAKAQAEDRAALLSLIRERYMRGEPNYLKMLLNQENPYAVGRLANYLDYFTKAQRAKIDDLRQQAQIKRALQTQQNKNLKDLQGHYQQQQTQQQDLDQAKLARLVSVNKLQSKVRKTSVKLAQLRQDRQRLNSLLQQIAKQADKMRKLEQQRLIALREQDPAATMPQAYVRPVVEGGFVKQRGRLRYPVSGKAEYKFGKRIVESGMRAQGTLIATKGSINVNSIFRGRVLFADYLKGYGLLMIVDHGDDHISLYGHNEVLYKQVGDRVATNEVVAKTGVSGGLKSHGLYFEIRNTATPVDPGIWCR